MATTSGDDEVISDEDDDLNHNNYNRKRRKSISVSRVNNGDINSNNSDNKINNNYTGKRGLSDYAANNDDSALFLHLDDNHDENGLNDVDYVETGCDGEQYPEIGVRATTTIEFSKEFFLSAPDEHFYIAQDILLQAVKRISQHRWIHEKYKITNDNIRYNVFINEELNIPKAFEQIKPKRGRPPKNKKQKVDNNNKNMKEWNRKPENDKIYRANIQIIFEYGIPEHIRHEIIQCIKIDLNQNSLSLLLTNVLSAKVDVTQKVQSYSLYAVDADKLKEYEKYERDEEARKKKKREREQKRRENKKKANKNQ